MLLIRAIPASLSGKCRLTASRDIQVGLEAGGLACLLIDMLMGVGFGMVRESRPANLRPAGTGGPCLELADYELVRCQARSGILAGVSLAGRPLSVRGSGIPLDAGSPAACAGVTSHPSGGSPDPVTLFGPGQRSRAGHGP